MITVELTFYVAASLPTVYGPRIKIVGGSYSRSRKRAAFGRDAEWERNVKIPLKGFPAFHLVDELLLHYPPHGACGITFSIEGRPELPAAICRRPWEGCICLSYSGFSCDVLRFDAGTVTP